MDRLPLIPSKPVKFVDFPASNPIQYQKCQLPSNLNHQSHKCAIINQKIGNLIALIIQSVNKKSIQSDQQWSTFLLNIFVPPRPPLLFKSEAKKRTIRMKSQCLRLSNFFSFAKSIYLRMTCKSNIQNNFRVWLYIIFSFLSTTSFWNRLLSQLFIAACYLKISIEKSSLEHFFSNLFHLMLFNRKFVCKWEFEWMKYVHIYPIVISMLL